jgi:predicted glutamine amidotransferase
MCRVLGYCSRTDVSVADLFGEHSLGAFTALSQWHADGWGMAAQDGGELRVAKSPLPAEQDPRYLRLTRQPLGDIGLVHLRWATPGLPVGQCNSHPFARDGFALAHNGAIRPQDRLAELLPPAWERQLTGTTDSERYFLHILSGLDANGGDVLAAVTSTVRRIRDSYTPNCLNAILLAPGALYAISWHDPALIPAQSIRERGSPEKPGNYFDLAYRHTPDAVVVGSTGWPQDGWTTLPNGSVLSVDRATLAVRVDPLLPALVR